MKDEQLKITGPHYIDEKHITQIPTNKGHMSLYVCAAAARINPKTLYFRLTRTADAWSRDDILVKKQNNCGGGYRADDDLIKAVCRDLGQRREITSIKEGSWERRCL